MKIEDSIEELDGRSGNKRKDSIIEKKEKSKIRDF